MNTRLLKAKIIEKGFSVTEFIQKTGIKRAPFYRKLNKKTEFNRAEIEKISSVLELSPEQMKNIFFDV